MIYSDATIRKKIHNGLIHIDPYIRDNVQPASVDVTLSNKFLEPKYSGAIINLDKPIRYTEYIADKTNGFVLRSHSFVLASTAEYIKIPSNVTAWIEGRSSIGRAGLFIQNAGWIDPGFEGSITLELFNASDFYIRLIPGTKVGQIIFAELDSDCENPYNGKYQGQKVTTGSKIYEDFKS